METLRARYRGAPNSVREARKAVVDYARMCGFATGELNDIEVAVGEALANAVEHGTRNLGFITVTCSFDGSGLVIEIRDDGSGFDHVTGARRDPRSIRGFGISLMRALMDDVRYVARGNVVQLVKTGPKAHAQRAAFEERA